MSIIAGLVAPLYQEDGKASLPRVVFILTPCVVIAIGVFALMFFEGWPMLTCFYVLTQIVTTVGYGDFTVQSDSAKVFMAFYSLGVLVVLAYYVTAFVDKIIEVESDVLRRHLRNLEVRLGVASDDSSAKKAQGLTNELIATLLLFAGVLLSGVVFFRVWEHCVCSYGFQAISGCIDSDFATCVKSGGYVKDWADSLYMAVITLTTIGFGDYQPRTHSGRIFGIVWMLFGVGVAAATVSILSKAFIEKRRESRMISVEENVDDIDEQVFAKIDKDGNGFLSEGEYMTYILLKYKMVPEDLLDTINAQFDKLDTTKGNRVTYEIIEERQQRLIASK